MGYFFEKKRSIRAALSISKREILYDDLYCKYAQYNAYERAKALTLIKAASEATKTMWQLLFFITTVALALFKLFIPGIMDLSKMSLLIVVIAIIGYVSTVVTVMTNSIAIDVINTIDNDDNKKINK